MTTPPPRRTRRSGARTATVATLAAVFLLTACGDGGGRATGSQRAAPATPGTGPTQPASTPPATSPDPDGTGPDPSERLPLLEVLAGGVRLEVDLLDNAPARDLLAHLPVTVRMSELGGVEKTGRLPQPLSLRGVPDGADPDVGDLGYYAPGQDLVLYHGDQGYHPGIVRLGTLRGDLQALADLEGDVEVTVRRLGRPG